MNMKHDLKLFPKVLVWNVGPGLVLCLFLMTGSLPLGWGPGVRHSVPLTWARQPTLSGQTLEHIYWWLAVYHLGPRLKFLSLYSLRPTIKMLWDFISW